MPDQQIGRVAARVNRKFAVTKAAYRAAGLADGTELDRLVGRNVAFTFGYYARAPLLLDGRQRRRLQHTFDVSGADRLVEARARGQGIVLVAAHVGDFDLAGSVLAEKFGLPPVVCAARVGSRTRQAWYDRVRTACGFTFRPKGPTAFERLLADLRRGGLVITMLDRASGRYGTNVRFLGLEARIPATAFLLAASTGAPMLSAVTFRRVGGRRVLALGTPQRATDPADADACAATMRHAADEISAHIRAAPSQWHVPAYPHELPWLADSWISHRCRGPSPEVPRTSSRFALKPARRAEQVDEPQHHVEALQDAPAAAIAPSRTLDPAVGDVRGANLL